MRKNKRGGAGGPATDRANASPLRNASKAVRKVVPQSLLRNKLPLAACLLLLLLPCVSKAQAPPNPDAFPTPIRNNSFTFVGNLSASYVLLPLSRRTQPYPITQAWNGYQNVSSNGIITSCHRRQHLLRAGCWRHSVDRSGHVSGNRASVPVGISEQRLLDAMLLAGLQHDQLAAAPLRASALPDFGWDASRRFVLVQWSGQPG